MIQIKNLSKIYEGNEKVDAVKGVNLTIKYGEIFGIIGASGAGKSTLLRCLNLLEMPTAGQIIIDGVEITSLNRGELRQARQKIGMIFQHFNLLSSRTVAENVEFPLEIAGVRKKIRQARVQELLELVGLTNRANYYPAQLSGGQKQRVGIARALANEPKVLLCDEATSALDPVTTNSILQLLREINRQMGLTVVLVTHEMSVIKNICEQVAVMDQGLVVEMGAVQQIFTAPKSYLTQQFIEQAV